MHCTGKCYSSKKHHNDPFKNVSGCSALKSITIPDGVTKIQIYAFGDCTELTTVNFPQSIDSVDSGAFRNTPWLKAEQAKNPLVIVNHSVVNGDAVTGDLTIPDGITTISSNAFAWNSKLTSVVIPDSVTNIESWAFYGTGITRVNIPESIQNIASGTFCYCNELTSIVFPESVTRIEWNACNDCQKLTDITIPAGVSYFGMEAFSGTPWMTAQQAKNPLVTVNHYLIDASSVTTSDVTLPDGILGISDSAFRKNTAVKSIIIPDSVTVIESYAFEGCTALEKVTVPRSVEKIGYGAFIECENVTVYGYRGSKAETYANTNKVPFTALDGDSTEPVSATASVPVTTYTTTAAVSTTVPITASASATTSAVVTTTNQTPAVLTAGDLTGDSSVGIDDAQLTLKAYTEKFAGKTTGLTDAQIKAADVNGDGELTVEDAQFILKYYTEKNVAGKDVTWEQIIGKKNTIPNKLPDTGDKLSILCWTDDDLKTMISHFEAANPQYKDKVQFVEVGSNSTESREHYANYFAGDEDADLYIMTADWAIEYLNNNNYSVPITDLGFNESDFAECYAYTLDEGRDNKGALKAVAWQASPGGYVYRADLAEKYLGVANPDEMQKYVKDWDTFTQTAETIRKASNGKTALADTKDGIWQAWKHTVPSGIVKDDGTVSADDAFCQYAAFVKQYQDNGYVTKQNQWFTEWYEIGQDDSTMGFFYSTWCLPNGSMLEQAEGGKNGATYAKYRITEGPAPWYWGGHWIALSPKCDNGTIAHDFISHFVINPDTIKSYAKQTGEFVNNAAVNTALAAEGFGENPLLGGQSPIAVLHRNAKAVRGPEYAKHSCYEDEIKWFICLAAEDYANSNKVSLEDALEDFKARAKSGIESYKKIQ